MAFCFDLNNSTHFLQIHTHACFNTDERESRDDGIPNDEESRGLRRKNRQRMGQGENIIEGGGGGGEEEEGVWTCTG